MVGMLRSNVVRLDCDQFSSHSYMERQGRIAKATSSGNPEWIEREENPKNWYAFDDIISALRDLKSKRTHTYDRAWNRQTGELDERYEVALDGDGPSIILCDCIYLLHPPIRAALDVAILVETDAEIVTERGRLRSKGDTGRASYMESLRQKYSVPYFETFGRHANIRYKGES